MKTTINLHVEIECEDDSVDKGLVADFICASVARKYKKVDAVIVYDADNSVKLRARQNFKKA